MIFELATDFSDALAAMPVAHQNRRMLELLEEAIRRDIHFIAGHPTTLFQCMWNTCWWYDCPGLERYYDPPEKPAGLRHWEQPGPKVHTFAENWRTHKGNTALTHAWIRSLRPPALSLGAGQRMVLQGHTGSVHGVGWSPDGRTIASGSADGTIRLWDAPSGSQLAAFPRHWTAVTCLNWSPNGRCIGSGSADGTIRLLDASTGSVLALLRGHEKSVRCLTWSPDGHRITSGAADGTLRIWDIERGLELAVLVNLTRWTTAWDGYHEGESYLRTVLHINGISWCPDGHRLAIGSGSCEREYDDPHVLYQPGHAPLRNFYDALNSVRILDTDSGVEISTLLRNSVSLNTVSWSPDGGCIASGSGNVYRLWGQRFKAAVRKAKKAVEVGTASLVHLWDPVTGAALAELEGHTDSVLSVCWSPDSGRIATGAADNTVRVWDIATRSAATVFRGHTDDVTSVGWSPDGDWIVSGSKDGTLRIWNAHCSATAPTLRGHTDSCGGKLLWSPEGRLCARRASFMDDGDCRDERIRVWDVERGTPVSLLEASNREVYCLRWAPNSRHVAAGLGTDAAAANSVRVWDSHTGDVLAVFDGHEAYVNSLDWSPDGRRIATGSADKTVRVWDLATKAGTATLLGHKGFVYSVRWSPDGGRVASGSSDGTVCIWDVDRTMSLGVLRGIPEEILSVTWSSDARYIFSASATALRIWHVESGAEVAHFFHDNLVTARRRHSTWSHEDGFRVVLPCDTSIGYSREAKTQLMFLSTESREMIQCARISSDGRHVAAADRDGIVRIWELKSHVASAVLRGHSDAPSCVCWSPDGLSIATASNGGTVTVWDVKAYLRRGVFGYLRGGLRRLWKEREGCRSAVLGGDGATWTAMNWSCDGKRIAGATNEGIVRVWNVQEKAEVAVLHIHGQPIIGLHWWPHNSSLLSVCGNHSIQVWDVDACECRETISGYGLFESEPLSLPWYCRFPAEFEALTVSPQGKFWAGEAQDQLYLIAVEEGQKA